ncbi:MAG: hypothetical protein PVG84_18705 [Desulfobacterales bacterium]
MKKVYPELVQKKLMSSFSVGASNKIAGGIPAAAGLKMCTNC